MKKISYILFVIGLMFIGFYFINNDKKIEENVVTTQWDIIYGNKIDDNNISLYSSDVQEKVIQDISNKNIKRYKILIPKNVVLQENSIKQVEFSSEELKVKYIPFICDTKDYEQYIESMSNNLLLGEKILSKTTINNIDVYLLKTKINAEYSEKLYFMLKDEKIVHQLSYELNNKKFDNVFLDKIVNGIKIENIENKLCKEGKCNIDIDNSSSTKHLIIDYHNQNPNRIYSLCAIENVDHNLISFIKSTETVDVEAFIYLSMSYYRDSNNIDEILKDSIKVTSIKKNGYDISSKYDEILKVYRYYIRIDNNNLMIIEIKPNEIHVDIESIVNDFMNFTYE